MRASIIIPVFNKYELTRNCLLSLRQTAAGAEVILVDNGSSDDTQARLPVEFPEVRYYRQDVNHGYAGGNNIGSRHATGDYIVLLNNDTITEPGWLEPLLDTFAEKPQAGVVGARLLYPERHIQHAGVAFNGGKDPFHIYRNAPEDFPPVTRLRRYPAVTGACFAMPRTLYTTLGGLAEDYRNGFEDVDLCLRVAEAGYEVWYQGASKVIHLESQTPGRKKFERENQQLFYQRWRDKIHSDWTQHYQDDGFDTPMFPLIDRLAQSAQLSRYVPDTWRYAPHDTAVRALIEGWGTLVEDPTLSNGAMGSVRPDHHYLKYELAVTTEPTASRGAAGVLRVAAGTVLGADVPSGAQITFPAMLTPHTALQLLSVNLQANDPRRIRQAGMKSLRQAGFDSRRYGDEFASLWPLDVETLKYKTEAALSRQELTEAIDNLAAFYEDDRYNTWVTLRLADLLTRAGRADEATPMLDDFLQIKPFHLRGRSLRLKAHLASRHA